MIQVRVNNFNHLLRCGELFQQYLVDQYAKVDAERLSWHFLNQKKIRAEQYKKAVLAVDGDAPNIGKPIILAASYIGGPRYMHKKTQDAMAYVRAFGRPTLFITFTSNPNWKEIKIELFSGQVFTDRPDLVARVFKLKLDVMKDLLL